MQNTIWLTCCNYSSLIAGRQQATDKEQGAATPRSHNTQPPPSFTSADIKRYQRRREEGYDVPDPHYRLWLESVSTTTVDGHASTSFSTVTASPAGDDPKSVCQTGNCGHPKARQWIACDLCPRWHHCLCAGISHKNAKSTRYTCSACS